MELPVSRNQTPLPPPATPRKTITVGFDENLNPNPESVSMRAQYRAQIVAAFTQHLATLNYLLTTFRKPLKGILAVVGVQTLFADLKALYKLYNKLNKALTKSHTSEKLERDLFDIFTGKLGKELEVVSVNYALNYRTSVVPLLVSLKDSPKMDSILEAHTTSNSVWSSSSLEELLDSVTLFTGTYPLHFDRLLQETPLQSEQYQLLQQTLGQSRNIARLVGEAKDGTLTGDDLPAEVHAKKKTANFGGRFHLMVANICGHI